MELIFTLNTIEGIAAQIVHQIGATTVLAFEGEMGAGKTTFIKALCTKIGVTDLITSPTFSIINEYTTTSGKTVFHIDLYRLKDEQEAINAGAEDCLLSGNLCFIEWPDKIAGLLPKNTLRFSIFTINATTRKIIISKFETL